MIWVEDHLWALVTESYRGGIADYKVGVNVYAKFQSNKVFYADEIFVVC